MVLLIGGNMGDRLALIEQATSLVRQRMGEVARLSSIYESEPWGDFGDEVPQAFLNRALLVNTPLAPHAALAEAMAIEGMLGRERKEGVGHYSSRPMDIDIIFYGQEIIDTPTLQVPHPRAHLREFVLAPMAEIVPQYVHPQLGQTVEQLLLGLRLGLGHADVAQSAVAIEPTEVNKATDA